MYHCFTLPQHLLTSVYETCFELGVASDRNYSLNHERLTVYTVICLLQIAASLEKNLIPRLSSSPPDIEALRLYHILPECPLFSDRNNYVTIAIPFAKSLLSLKEAPLKVLGKIKLVFISALCHM